jgi:molecular chaperone DnaJ
MAKEDYYKTLGVDKNVSNEDLKKVYRKMAMKYHPDRNPDNKEAEAKFKEVKEAYEVLSDEQKRAQYDRFGHQENYGDGGGGFNGGGFEDMFNMFNGGGFEDLFGGGSRQSRQKGPQRGSDLRYRLEITLEQAAKGHLANIRIPNWDECNSCDGTGSKSKQKPKVCGTCHGQGVVNMRQGFFAVQQECPTCKGKGYIIPDPCRVCNGTGHQKTEKDVEVKIPAGVDNGSRIRLTGKGEPGQKGGERGDLYVETLIKEHAVFERDGDDLYCRVNIPMTTAALGGDINVTTIDNTIVQVNIAHGTQSGKKMRLSGKGMPNVRSGIKGNFIIQLWVDIPEKLTEHQRQLLRQLADSFEGKSNQKSDESHSDNSTGDSTKSSQNTKDNNKNNKSQNGKNKKVEKGFFEKIFE